MKRIILFLAIGVFVLSFLLLLVPSRLSLAENQIHNGDWEYDLPNGYTIWHVNSQEIVLGHYNTSNSISTVIEGIILEFCHNDDFVCVKTNNGNESATSQNDPDSVCYYLINTIDETVYGPYTYQEFEDSLTAFGVNTLTDWIATKPAPDGATYGQ